MNKEKICLIISGGKYIKQNASSLKADFTIACDKGYENAERYGIKPDLILGDFDSVSEENMRKIESSGIKSMRYPKEKDDTDTMIAVKHALDMGFTRIKLICAFGGRPDHSFSNIQTAHYAAMRGAVVELVDEGSYITVFADGKIEIDRQDGVYLSVFSLSDRSSGVSIKGTKYELENAELTGDFPLGVSNEFKEKKAAVSVKSGCLMVMLTSYDHIRIS